MKVRALCFPVVVVLVSLACGTDPLPAEDLEHREEELQGDDTSSDGALPDSLDSAPFWMEAEVVDGSWSETLDFAAFDPERPLTVFIGSNEEAVSAVLRNAETGAVLAESVYEAEVEEDGSTRVISKLEVEPGLAGEFELVVEQPFDPEIRLVVCDRVVTNRNPSGYGSLQYAVDYVQPGGSVCFDPVEFGSGPPLVLSHILGITESMSIIGPLFGQVVLESSPSKRVMQVWPNTSVSVLGVSFRGGGSSAGAAGGLIYTDADNFYLRDSELEQGEADIGGGIYATGDLSMRDCLVHDVAATDGGGIYAEAGLFLLDSEVNNANASGHGGGIYAMGTTRVERTTLSTNDAGSGGGFYANGADVSFIDSQALQNTAGYGGGGYSRAGDLQTTAGSVFAGNVAGSGGGLSLLTSSATLEGLFHENEADGYGGAIEVYDAPVNGGRVVIEGARITHNVAAGGGGVSVEGADLELRGVTLRENEAFLTGNLDGGGGIAVRWGSLDVHNDASGTPTVISENQGDVGGGIACQNRATVRLWDDTVVEANQAYKGGGVSCRGDACEFHDRTSIRNNLAEFGGGAHNSYLLELLGSARITGNVATRFGGGVQGVPPVFMSAAAVIDYNSAGGRGGGLCSRSGTPRLEIRNNTPDDVSTDCP